MHWGAEALLQLSRIDGEEPTVLPWGGGLTWRRRHGNGAKRLVGRSKHHRLFVLMDRYCFYSRALSTVVHILLFVDWGWGIGICPR